MKLSLDNRVVGKLQFLNKSNIRLYPLLALIILFSAACNQDPIFHTIFQDVKPRDPRVPGTPTTMVVFERMHEYPAGVTTRVPVVYVASGKKLYWYVRPDPPNNQAAPEKWWNREKGKIEQPGGIIIDLAATDNYLYVLYRNSLKRIAWNSNTWETIQADAGDKDAISKTNFNTIFSSNNRIFIGALSTEKKSEAIPCSILYVTDTAGIKILKSNTHLLEGVAFNGTSYFLCTNNLYTTGGSLIKINDTGFPASALEEFDDANKAFKGIISLENDENNTNHAILAMDRAGTLYTIDSEAKTLTSGKTLSGSFTGALALWRDPASTDWDTNDLSKLPRPLLLLAGYKENLSDSTSTGYSNGYREYDLQWKPDGTLEISDNDFHEPGKTDVNGITTVHNFERYLNKIGKNPIKSMFQIPKIIDADMILFASTVNTGLWSYRERVEENKEKVFQWNAEE